MKFKRMISLLTILFTYLLFPQKVLAICPVCTISVGAGLGFSRWLGIDDVVTALWIGGLIISMIMWTLNWLSKKELNFKFKKIIITTFYYLIIIIPLYWTGTIGHPYNKIWGIDKLLLGIILGSLVFLIGGLSYYQMKKKNNNRAYFPFQKVVMPVTPLIILSIIFWFITKK